MSRSADAQGTMNTMRYDMVEKFNVVDSKAEYGL